MRLNQDAIEYGNQLEQQIINKYHLNKIEVFYLFNYHEGTFASRMNDIFEGRNQPFCFPVHKQEEGEQEEEKLYKLCAENEFEFELPQDGQNIDDYSLFYF